MLDGGLSTGLGDTFLNYRYQAVMEGPGRPAFSPRASLVVPSGEAKERRGGGSYGLQVNMPFSKQQGNVYWHWNGGFTWLPGAESDDSGANAHANLMAPFLSGSAIYRLKPMFHLMLENVLLFQESFDGGQTARETFYSLSPGFRGGWNVGDAQIVTGAALPITWGGGLSDVGLLLVPVLRVAVQEIATSYQLPATSFQLPARALGVRTPSFPQLRPSAQRRAPSPVSPEP